MKHLQVSCAVIEQDGRVLAAQRSAAMSLPLKWEFPGGKLQPFETAADCLVREIQEELGVAVRIISALPPADWQYAAFAITLYPFLCRLEPGRMKLAEHKAVAWVKPADLLALDWAEADIPVVQNYLATLAAGAYAR